MRYVAEDINVAAFFIAKGCDLDGLEPMGRLHFGFIFQHPNALALAQSYYNDAECCAQKFSMALKELKQRIYKARDERNQNEKFYTRLAR